MVPDDLLDRRRVLMGGAALSCVALDGFLGAPAAAEGAPIASFQLVGADVASTPRRMHAGQGAIGVKYFFEPERPGRPALFLQYDLPPGTSEGVHVHGPGRAEGAWDEYYYIVSGAGRMSIDGRDVAVRAGDHVHTPLGVAHGIENTSASEPLRVLLTAISRAGEERPPVPA